MMGNDDRRAVFLANLHRLAELRKLDFDGLAAAIGAVRGKKKWLRRAWTEGVARYDPRTSKNLWDVAHCLGLRSTADFWKPDVSVDPATLKTAEFERLVYHVRFALEALQKLRAKYPFHMNDIEAEYGFNELRLVATWVSEFYGKLTDKDTRLMSEFEEKMKSLYVIETQLEGYERDMNFVQRVFARLRETGEWKRQRDHLIEMFAETDEVDTTNADRKIFDQMTEAMTRHPTEEEVFQRYFSRYLKPYSDR